jgi:hypothetical protein
MDSRVELKDYKGAFVIATISGRSATDIFLVKYSITTVYDESLDHLIGTNIYSHLDAGTYSIANQDYYTIVFDINTLDLSSPETPIAVPLVKQLVEDTHPLCFIPEKYRYNKATCPVTARFLKQHYRNLITSYFLHSLEEEVNKLPVNPVNEDSNFIVDVEDKYTDKMLYRFQKLCFSDNNRDPRGSSPVIINLLQLKSFFEGSRVNYSEPVEIEREDRPLVHSKDIRPPVVSWYQRSELIKEAKTCWKPRNCWNYDPPNEVEFEDNSEMLEKVKQHLSMIKGLEITYLRKRMLAYYSDGAFAASPDAAPEWYHPPFLTSHVSDPLLYSGEAWSLHFTINNKDYQRNNFIYFCTPDQYVKAMMSMYREDLVENWEPWSDLIFISSDWCERNGKVNYNDGIDLSTPHRRRLSLAAWILGPFIQKCVEDGLGNPLEGFATIVSPRFNRNRWQTVAEAKKLISEYTTDLEHILPVKEK